MTIFKRTLFDENKLLQNKVHHIQRDSEDEAIKSISISTTENQKNEDEKPQKNENFYFKSKTEKKKFKFFEEGKSLAADNQTNKKFNSKVNHQNEEQTNLDSFNDNIERKKNYPNNHCKFAKNDIYHKKIDYANSDFLFEELQNNCRKSLQGEFFINNSNEKINFNKNNFTEFNSHKGMVISETEFPIDAENNFDRNYLNVYNKFDKEVNKTFKHYANISNFEASSFSPENDSKNISLANDFTLKTYNSQYFINKKPQEEFYSQASNSQKQTDCDKIHNKNLFKFEKGYDNSGNIEHNISYKNKGHLISSHNNIYNKNIYNHNNNNKISNKYNKIINRSYDHRNNNNNNNFNNVYFDNETIDFEISLEDPEKKDSREKGNSISNRSLEKLERELENKNFFASAVNCTKDNSCCICNISLYESSGEENKIIYSLPCKHNYHKDCFIRWYSVKKTCPLCRLNLNFEFDFPIKNNKLNFFQIFEINSDMGNIENINYNFKINRDLKMIEDQNNTN